MGSQARRPRLHTGCAGGKRIVFFRRFAWQICWFAATKSFPLMGKFLKGIDLRRFAPRSPRPADPAVNLLLNGELLILIIDRVGG